MTVTKEIVIGLRKERPELRIREIAEKTGVSKQRVFAILKQEKLPTKGTWARVSRRVCPVCSKTPLNNKAVCEDCKEKHLWVEKKCSWCHSPKIFRRRLVEYKKQYLGQENFFCNRDCFHMSRKKGI